MQNQLPLREEKNILDNVPFKKEDLEEFKKLMEVKEGALPSMTPGDILKGRIVEIQKDYVVVDVGLKSEGLISISEFVDPEELVLDKEIEVFLDRMEGSDGQIVLSKEKAHRQRQWEHILKNSKEGSIINGTVIRKVKGGLMVDIGIEAFLPGSQIDNKRIKNLDEFLGKTFPFKILKINIERKNIVVSRRELMEEELESKKTELLSHIKEGDITKGIVKNITDFGVFLDLNGADGLLHITDMSWDRRIRHPSEKVKLGEELEVMVLSIDKEKGRISLGLKQKEKNPLEEIEEKYPIGTLIKGKVVNLAPYGAFVEIEKGIEGLIHISEMSWTEKIKDPREIVKINDEIEAIVLDIQKDEGKISLGLKQKEKNPWENIEEKYFVGKKVKATVSNLTNYGVFVELEPGVDALMHISDLSWNKKVSHPSEVFKKGDSVEAQILSVDKESKKITLGIKQLTPNPWETIKKTIPVGSMVKGTVFKITAFGVFVKLENGIEALIHVSELSDQPIGKIENIVSIGDEIEAKVIKIDSEHKKIDLSMKDYMINDQETNRDDIIVTENNEEETNE